MVAVLKTAGRVTAPWVRILHSPQITNGKVVSGTLVEILPSRDALTTIIEYNKKFVIFGELTEWLL